MVRSQKSAIRKCVTRSPPMICGPISRIASKIDKYIPADARAANQVRTRIANGCFDVATGKQLDTTRALFIQNFTNRERLDFAGCRAAEAVDLEKGVFAKFETDEVSELSLCALHSGFE